MTGEIAERESQRESWTGASSKAAVGHAADANGAAERLNAVGLVGMGGGQQYSGCGGGSVQWLVVGGSVTVAVVGGSGDKWLWLEAVVASGCGWRQ